MGLLPLTYRRPAYVVEKPESVRPESASSKVTLHDDTSSRESLQPIRSASSVRSRSSGSSCGIPSALSFDKIMEGGTCPPCTVRDFMNYLIYVERSAENLQFLLWFRDYERRFADADTADLSLAPEWTQTMEDEAVARIKKTHADKVRKVPDEAVEIFKGTDFERGSSRKGSIPGSLPDTEASQSLASQAFAAAGTKAPFTIQPFRKELDRVVATYIMDDAPRQLNLSDYEQKTVLHALSCTTHPSAFRLIARQTEATLRQQAHPNFIRWSICNGNPARVWFARALGVGTILLGIAAGVVLTLSRAARGYRALAAVALVVGFATLVAAYKGMCVVLHGLHHRHVRPWELFVSDVDDEDGSPSASKASFNSFGSANSYEDEPWVVRYRRRNVVRKIFDREVWVQEPALRQIQDTIFVQSILFALLCSGVLTAVFVVVPGGGLF